MVKKKKSLGRGLDALLGSAEIVEEANALSQAVDGELRQMPVEKMQAGTYQPRSAMDPVKLQELADSISAQGMVQPIVVRPHETGQYEIIAGERRWRAAQLAGIDTVPVVVRKVSDRVTIAMALIENIQREDLSPLEEATALSRLLQEFEMTHQEAADAVGRSRTAVSNMLRLLDLAPAVKKLVDEKQLDMGHARAILGVEADDQIKVAHEVVKKGLNVRQTEQLVRKWKTGESDASNLAGKQIDSDIQRLQDIVSEQLCASVSLTHSAKGKGKMVVQYNSLDELDGILEKLGIESE